jgi:hypothetical protein
MHNGLEQQAIILRGQYLPPYLVHLELQHWSML